MKVLLTHSYFLRFDAKQWKQQQPFAPLGTLYAASVLRNVGNEVVLFDVMFRKNANEISQIISTQKPDAVVIYDDGFNYLTKMCLTNMREAAFEMIQIAKANNCKVIISSSDSTDHYEEYLQKGADFVLLGEAEQTLVELTSNIDTNQNSFENIKGIAYKIGDKISANSKRNVLTDLDAIPFPAWDLIDLQPYIQAWKKSSGYFSINMSTTRGCPFKCNWCAKPIYGNRYNVRSVKNVLEEIQFLKKKFPVEHIWFCDDIFGLKPGWVNEFADELIRKKIQIRFKIQSRVDLLLKENNIKSLALAGCESVWVGAESGSQKVLDAMDKGTTVEQIAEATQLLKKHKIKVGFFLQFGYLGETKDDIKATLKMVEELHPDDIGVSVSYPLPGTKFYEIVKNDLKAKTNWTDSDELAMMFRNTFPQEFYKDLHRYIHRKFRRKQGEEALETFFMFDGNNFNRLKKIAAMPYHFSGELIQKSKLNKHLKLD